MPDDILTKILKRGAEKNDRFISVTTSIYVVSAIFLMIAYSLWRQSENDPNPLMTSIVVIGVSFLIPFFYHIRIFLRDLAKAVVKLSARIDELERASRVAKLNDSRSEIES